MFGDTYPVVKPFKPQEAWDSWEDGRSDHLSQAPRVLGEPSAAPRGCLRWPPGAHGPPAQATGHRPHLPASGPWPQPRSCLPLPAQAVLCQEHAFCFQPGSLCTTTSPPALSPEATPLDPPGPPSGFVPPTWASELTACEGWPCPSAWSPGLGVVPASKRKQGKVGTQCCRAWARSPPALGADPHVSPQREDQGP